MKPTIFGAVRILEERSEVHAGLPDKVVLAVVIVIGLHLHQLALRPKYKGI